MRRVLVGACWSLLPALLMAQSLGEVAKKERERRKNQGAPVQSFTNEDVSTLDEASGDDASREAAAVSPVFSATSPASPAPAFSLEDRDGRRVSLSDFRGRVVLLDFWATWCAPCRASMPKVEKLYQRFGARGLQVIGVNIEGRSDDVLEYIEDGGYGFLFLFDDARRAEVSRAYGVSSIPRSYLIDRQGRIVYAGHPENLSEALVEASLE